MPRRVISSQQFCLHALQEFDWLLEFGFLGPEVSEYRLAFGSSEMRIQVLYDAREGRMVVLIAGAVGERYPQATLDCLYVATDFGPPQDIRSVIRSEKMILPVLQSQRSALEKVLPLLQTDSLAELLLRCNGR